MEVVFRNAAGEIIATDEIPEPPRLSNEANARAIAKCRAVQAGRAPAEIVVFDHARARRLTYRFRIPRTTVATGLPTARRGRESHARRPGHRRPTASRAGPDDEGLADPADIAGAAFRVAHHWLQQGAAFIAFDGEATL